MSKAQYKIHDFYYFLLSMYIQCTCSFLEWEHFFSWKVKFKEKVIPLLMSSKSKISTDFLILLIFLMFPIKFNSFIELDRKYYLNIT